MTARRKAGSDALSCRDPRGGPPARRLGITSCSTPPTDSTASKVEGSGGLMPSADTLFDRRRYSVTTTQAIMRTAKARKAMTNQFASPRSNFSLRDGSVHSRTLAGARTVAGLGEAATAGGFVFESKPPTDVSGSDEFATTGREAAGDAVEATGVSTLGDEAAASALDAAGVW